MENISMEKEKPYDPERKFTFSCHYINPKGVSCNNALSKKYLSDFCTWHHKLILSKPYKCTGCGRRNEKNILCSNENSKSFPKCIAIKKISKDVLTELNQI